jgi:hypothetical protein
MSARVKRAQLAAGIVGALTVATVALSTSPASASGTYSGRAYVYGAGAFTDDWDDEGIVDTNDNSSSNATCVWQKVLWANGYLPWSGIDGAFGNTTKAATLNYQTDNRLQADGSAGKSTWAWAALGQLSYVSGSTDAGESLSLQYSGSHGSFSLIRDANGTYQFWDQDGVKRLAGYDYRTCS